MIQNFFKWWFIINNKPSFEKNILNNLHNFVYNYKWKCNKVQENSNMTMKQYFAFPWQLTLKSLIDEGGWTSRGRWKKDQKPIVR